MKENQSNLEKQLTDLKKRKKVKCTRVYTGKFHKDNHEALVEDLKERIKAERPEANFQLKVSGQQVDYIENGEPTEHFWYLPKINKRIGGMIHFTEVGFSFVQDGASVGSPEIHLLPEYVRDYGFELPLPFGSLQYHFDLD